MPIRVVNIFNDPTEGTVNLRIVRTMTEVADRCTTLTTPEKERFGKTLLAVAWKLVAAWTHLDRYIRLEEGYIKQAKDGRPVETQRVQSLEHRQDLFLELDESLVQLKSTLDYLVKIPVPIFGERAWSLRTFGRKGEDVERALLRNIPKKYLLRAKGIIAIFITRYKPWLSASIEARDRMNHFLEGGVNLDAFVVLKSLTPRGETIIVPMWDADTTVRKAMEGMWGNLVLFTEEFIGTFLGFRLIEGMAMFHGSAEPYSTESPWKITTEEHFRGITADRTEVKDV